MRRVYLRPLSEEATRGRGGAPCHEQAAGFTNTFAPSWSRDMHCRPRCRCLQGCGWVASGPRTSSNRERIPPRRRRCPGPVCHSQPLRGILSMNPKKDIALPIPLTSCNDLLVQSHTSRNTPLESNPVCKRRLPLTNVRLSLQIRILERFAVGRQQSLLTSITCVSMHIHGTIPCSQSATYRGSRLEACGPEGSKLLACLPARPGFLPASGSKHCFLFSHPSLFDP
ncbi:hypothetical protein CCHR01_17615 [Colletotrichum chrysophilum]|uniref:Uncharacterized protein n=1 Tax=Colletotrichum chrysophilum TaxID=1836956 RepID=A0AAD9E8X8_9PEZI|nr:hypothetical protein CCHR01_17615 [Colletotrichum chrysophilum]